MVAPIAISIFSPTYSDIEYYTRIIHKEMADYTMLTQNFTRQIIQKQIESFQSLAIAELKLTRIVITLKKSLCEKFVCKVNLFLLHPTFLNFEIEDIWASKCMGETKYKII